MRWSEFINLTKDCPVIELSAFFGDDKSIRVQVSRWVKTGKLIKLKRGYYILNKPYRTLEPYEPYVASILKRPSYLSLEKALEHYSLIPEKVVAYTSVTTKRQNKYKNEIGVFNYRHIKKELFWGYSTITVNNQTGYIARPEKAILDYFYLTRADLSMDYMDEMRFQNIERLDTDKLKEYAGRFRSKRISDAAERMVNYIERKQREEKKL